jgi:hypothetical protein
VSDLEKYRNLAFKYIKQDTRRNMWFEQMIVSALSKGEQFHADHKRPMTYEEKGEWLKAMRKTLESSL